LESSFIYEDSTEIMLPAGHAVAKKQKRVVDLKDRRGEFIEALSGGERPSLMAK